MNQDGHELILPSRISLASFTEINGLPDVSKCSNEIDETLKVYYSNPIYQGIMLYPHQFHECKFSTSQIIFDFRAWNDLATEIKAVFYLNRLKQVQIRYSCLNLSISDL